MKFNKTTALLDKCYEVNLKVYGYVGKFPKAQKAVLGRQVLETANSLIDKITDALYLKDVAKAEVLIAIDLLLKKLMLYLRFAKDLSYLSYKAYEFLAREITEMGKMIGGWQKWQASEKSVKQSSPDFVELQDSKSNRSKGSVSYTLESPIIKRYLELKLNNPQHIVALKVGVFYKLFFQDAHYFRTKYNFMLRDLAAASSEVKIESCGFPVSSAEKYQKEVETLRLFEYSKS